jgi:2-dehydro-3-deoxy-D-arabinonate dehydratase
MRPDGREGTANMTGMWRVLVDGRPRLARGPVDAGPAELLAVSSLDEVLAEPGGFASALERIDGQVPAGARVVAPIEGQEVWASGVTYLRSRDARKEESSLPDHYDHVYEAERPELFLKAAPGRVRGPREPIGVRADSTWDVPEPELCVVADSSGEIVAYVVGNDVSSRSIEGDNPLYLPQAKSYTGSCSLGPCLVPVAGTPPPSEMEIAIRVQRNGATAFEGSTHLSEMKRSPADLVDWLFRAQDFPVGVFLLTGTGIVPTSEFTLQGGDDVSISILGLGELRNVVEQVGRT